MSMIDFEDRMSAPPLSLGELLLGAFVGVAGLAGFGCTVWKIGTMALNVG